jgi:predicted dehydrogenase
MTLSVAGPAISRTEQSVVIVGYGHAGSIHGKAYEGLGHRCVVSAVVEPNPDRLAEIESSLPGVKIYQELGAALKELGGEVIIDFCVPAKINLELVEIALSRGVNKIMIEEPLGWDVSSTNALVSKLDGCEVVYLDT